MRFWNTLCQTVNVASEPGAAIWPSTAPLAPAGKGRPGLWQIRRSRHRAAGYATRSPEPPAIYTVTRRPRLTPATSQPQSVGRALWAGGSEAFALLENVQPVPAHGGSNGSIYRVYRWRAAATACRLRGHRHPGLRGACSTAIEREQALEHGRRPEGQRRFLCMVAAAVALCWAAHVPFVQGGVVKYTSNQCFGPISCNAGCRTFQPGAQSWA